jgi:hypothetical protein
MKYSVTLKLFSVFIQQLEQWVINISYCKIWSLDSSVGIAIGYSWKAWVQFLAGQDFSPL